MEQALYLFCLARAGLAPELHITGLTSDSPLVVEAFGDVAAVVCEVPLDDFSGPSAETRLQDLGWVGPRAVRHGQVIEHVMQYSPVLPARFGTLFSSRESLGRLVQRNSREIITFLDSVAHKDEWAVKGLVSDAKVRELLFSAKLVDQRGVLVSLSPGVRYFKEKQIQAEVDKEMGHWLKEIMNTVAAQLTECSEDWRRREVVFETQEGDDRETVVNWAFLVDRGVADDFETRIYRANTEYNAGGVYFELSGPWPPYSFAPALEMEQD